MDKAAFAHWLGSLALLDAAQRLRVVAELTGDGAAVAAPDGAQRRGILGDAGGCAAVVTATQVSSAGPAADLLSQLGAERLARFGCPHCDAEDVQRWGRAAGKPRYRCKTNHTTAFRWRHRFLDALTQDMLAKGDGQIAVADEH